MNKFGQYFGSRFFGLALGEGLAISKMMEGNGQRGMGQIFMGAGFAISGVVSFMEPVVFTSTVDASSLKNSAIGSTAVRASLLSVAAALWLAGMVLQYGFGV